MIRSESLKLLVARMAGAIVAVAICACGDGAARTEERVEFDQHVREGRIQLARLLTDSARAEFRAARAWNLDPGELDFQEARLDAAEGLDGSGWALLSNAAELERARTQRFLYEFHRERGEKRSAKAARKLAVNRLGSLGALEMALVDSVMNSAGDGDGIIELLHMVATADLEQARRGAFANLVRAFRKLERQGEYAPAEAVPELEALFREHPDLAALRLLYAATLGKRQVRIPNVSRPDQPPMSSRLVADYAQLQLEHVLDQVHPRGALAREARRLLADVALRMADWDETVAWLDLLLEESALTRTPLLAQKAMALFKSGRSQRARALLVETLDGGPDPGDDRRIARRWILHLVEESLETPNDERKHRWRFRDNLDLAPDATAFAFEEAAERFGVDKFDGLGPAAWGDVDGDGDQDLFVGGCDSFGTLLIRDGARFRDVSASAGLLQLKSGFSTTLVDYDNDGDPDLFVGRDGWNGPMKNSMFANQGDGTFREITDDVGLAGSGSSFVHLWLDSDRDGLLDVFVANGITGAGDSNRLYAGNADGRFRDVTRNAGLEEPSHIKTIGAAVGDADGDGDPDLFVSGYRTTNRLYVNAGDGRFEERAEAAGVDGKDRITWGYVAFFLDADGDGQLDILRTALAPWTHVLLGLSERWDFLPQAQRDSMLQNCPTLYRNRGDGTFRDVSVAAGFIHPVGTMGAGVADLDNDGRIDVYLGTGDPDVARLEPDRFFRNESERGSGARFRDLTFASGLGNLGKGHGITFVDLDDDGDLELYACEGGFEHGDRWANALYLNGQSTGNHWLGVELTGTRSNRDGIGARLTLRASELLLVRERHGGEGFGSSNPPRIHFGLGSAEQVASLEVRWPSGAVQLLENVAANQVLRLVEPQD